VRIHGIGRCPKGILSDKRGLNKSRCYAMFIATLILEDIQWKLVGNYNDSILCTQRYNELRKINDCLQTGLEL